MNAKRIGIFLKPDSKRVLFRPFDPRRERALKIVARVLVLSEQEVKKEVAHVRAEFNDRHPKLQDYFFRRFEQMQSFLITDEPLSDERRLLIGAYFTQEYSLESAALFNPSMVWHPDQSDLPGSSRRFVLSLRATGEGHISSITFRSGVIDADNRIAIDESTRFVTTPEIVPDKSYEKPLFEKKLLELGLLNDFTCRVLDQVDEVFTIKQLQQNVNSIRRQMHGGDIESTANGILALAQSNYEVVFSPEQELSERIIFPTSVAELNGIEDARFVEFHDDGPTTYYATYTAYDGEVILPQLLETKDFLHFRISTLNGPEVTNKGMALFPRKINGLYAMLSRQDNENIYIMFSEMIHFWYSKTTLLKPTFPWEFVQLGNCGSPIETEAGWLVLSHGVGPMRRYAISAFLLDLNDPTKVIGRLKEPLLTPNENEREGYVPNVVYSCGGLIHNGELIIPYALSDYASSFAMVNLDELLNELAS
ncbi:glycoside hydrolase family 130 protein [bacterium]|nr:glycoside hydrolase family 130 protein [bacterium]